jgi:thymidylate synthase
MVAQQCDLDVGEFIWTGGDVHLYKNHVEQAKLQLEREPNPLPQLKLAKAEDIFRYKYEYFKIEGYEAHPHIKGEVAV